MKLKKRKRLIYKQEQIEACYSSFQLATTQTVRKMTLVPVSVNFHFTRRCNYQCGFCFHTAKTSHLTPVNVAKECLRQLRDLGMMKLNMSGGEPFLYPKYVGEIARFCKEDLKMKSVSVVSNGSKIRENFFQKYGKYLDILAVSCDSFDEQTNIEIGRGLSINYFTLTST